MHNLGIVEWADERINDNYPLARPSPVRDLIVDASFIQFDGFVPVVDTVTVNANTNLVIGISCWNGQGTLTFTVGDVSKSLSINGFHLGTVTVSPLVLQTYIQSRPTGTIRVGIPFHASTVLSVPSGNGVFGISDIVGKVVKFQAGTAVHSLPTVKVETGLDSLTVSCGFPASMTGSGVKLRTLNGVSPVDNNLVIAPSDLLKVDGLSGGLEISVASGADVAAIAPKARYA